MAITSSQTVNLLSTSNSNYVLNMPFSFSATGGVNTTTDLAKIWSDRVFATIGTRPGERVMNLKYGSFMQDYVFENVNVAALEVRNEITAVFSRYLTALTLNEVDVTVDYSDSGDQVIVASISYTLPTKQKDSIQVKLGTFTKSGDLIRETT